jgi:RNA polymerase sigma-70 factor (ECF subfamily)
MTSIAVRPVVFVLPACLGRFAARGTVVAMRSSASYELVELMGRISKGDQAAFADFYDATSRTVYGIVLRVLRDSAQAEEVAQEVYVEAWTSAPRFDAALGSPTGWLNTIAHRKAVDRVRSSERNIAREQRHFNAETQRVTADTSDIVVAQDESLRVREALDRLPESQRTAVRMAYFEGRSYREVAESLELPLGTVKTRIRDAMKRLRTSLGEAAS